MNIAELFVSLGVKGSEKTIGALSNVRKGLGEISSMSLEAKAGLLAVAYGLERLMSNSMQTGTNLTNFNALTGLSARSLQQWQYAARQAGVSGDELTSNLKGVQGAMTKMLMGEGAPKGLALVANATKNFDISRVRDTFYVMDQLQKAAQRLPKDIGNEALKSFGLSEGTIAAMRRNAFRPEILSKAPVYSEKETSQLDRVNIAWSNLGNKIQMAIGHFTAMHGMQLVQDLTKIADQVLRLAEAFTVLAEKLKLFMWIGKAFEGWTMIFDQAAKGIKNITTEVEKNGAGGALKNLGLGAAKGFVNVATGVGQDIAGAISPSFRQNYAPPQNQTFNVTQTLQFQHDGKDHKKTADSTRHAVQSAYRQISAQGQGS